MQTLQVRDLPLFSYAEFYHWDREMKGGADKIVDGPFHTNGNLTLNPQKGTEFRFLSHVSAAGKILRTSRGKVFIDDKRMKQGNGGILDHNHPEWEAYSQQYWDGYVRDKAHDTPVFYPLDMDLPQKDNPSTLLVNERTNPAYALIEPLLPADHTSRKSDAVRKQKFAYKAGLILKIEPNPSAGTSSDPTSTDYFVVNAYKYDREDPTDSMSRILSDVNGDPFLLPVDLPPGIIGAPNPALTDIDVSRGAVELYTTTGSKDTAGNVVSGFYDHDEDIAYDIIALDVGALTDLINSKDNTASGFNGTYNVDNDWNGVLYIEFPTSDVITGDDFVYGTSTHPDGRARADNVVIAHFKDNSDPYALALALIDAQELPNPSDPRQEGFTLSTNGTVYVVGSYNADGVAHTDDSTLPDDADEIPAAIACDSYMLLSSNWANTRKFSNRAPVGPHRPAVFTEISAALLAGYTAPNLENWQGLTQTMRYSKITLFERELRSPYTTARPVHCYKAPAVRDFGFNKLFADGRFPPGTPVVRTFRAVDFNYLSKADYMSAKANL